MKDNKHPLSNREIVDYFLLRETKSYLRKIYNNVIPSERHNIVCSMFESKKLDFGIYSRIFRLASAQFLEDDHKIDTQLWDILSKMFDTLDTKKIPELAFNEKEKDKYAMRQVLNMRHQYIFHVFVPEGIIRCLQEKYNWTWIEANDFFIDADSRITKKELEDFDEEINDEIKKETERKRRALYDSHDDESDEHSKEQSFEQKLSSLMKDDIRRYELKNSRGTSKQSNQSQNCIKQNNSADVGKNSNMVAETTPETWKGCTVASPDSTMDLNNPVVKHEVQNESSPEKNKKSENKRTNRTSNMSYCIESSVTTNGNNIIIKLIKVKGSNHFKEEAKPSIVENSSNSMAKHKSKSSRLYCFCRREYDGSFMVKCETCRESYHPRCLNVSSHEFISKTNKMKWHCPPCKNKKSIKRENMNDNMFNKRPIRVKAESSRQTYQSKNIESLIKTRADKKSDKDRNCQINQSSRKSFEARKQIKTVKSSKSLKIQTIEPVYCLCRRENDGTFMIGCDFCEEWYHPHCLRISNEKAIEYAKQSWSCPRCIIQNQKKKLKA